MNNEEINHSKKVSKKEGILYKKRDHFNEWLPRYFILEGNNFSYYRNYNQENLPYKTIEINQNINLTYDNNPLLIHNIQYYSFTISYFSNNTTTTTNTNNTNHIIYQFGMLKNIVSSIHGVLLYSK